MKRLIMAVVAVIAMGLAVGPVHPLMATGPTVRVGTLQPNWDPGVYSAYYGPLNGYVGVSPGTTAPYLGREAGLIKAGVTDNPLGSGSYDDEGLFGFQPGVTIDALASSPLTYDVVNQYGTNPVWMTIEIDTGVVGNRADNTAYQMVPPAYGSGAYNAVDAAAGTWAQWTTYTSGTLTGWTGTLSNVVTANTGLQVVRAFLRLGMGNSYGPGPNGTQAWVDAASIGGVTYDFVLPCTATCYVDAATGNDAFDGGTPGSAKKTIQAAVNQVSVGGTVNVAAGTYNEDVTINKGNVQLLGAGIDVSSIVGQIGPTAGGATIQVTAGGVLVDGFTVTRAGNNLTDWNNALLNTAGVAVQGQGNTVELRNSKITGMRTGIDINNSNGNSVHNNIIDNNRTGMIFRNQTDSTSVLNNFITNNWTLGVLFLDAAGGTNSPVQSAAGSTFSNNNISGNWYGQAEDRQAGLSLNPKNFEGNWWGTLPSGVSVAQATEPGYSALVPVAFGGAATAPLGQPQIKGSGSASIDYAPFQCSGTDTSLAVGFQPSGTLCSPPTPATTVVAASSMTATGWVFYNDEPCCEGPDPTLGSFVTGPGTPALGTGSAKISVTGTQRRNLATYQFSGTPLADITTLRFRTYNPSAGNGGTADRSAFLNFNVDFNGSDTWQKRLVFVPRQNGTVLQNTWQEWDAINFGAALWSYSGATWPVTGQPGTTLKSWAQILSDYPGVRIRVTDAHMGIRVGEPYSNGYTENIDTFTFGTASAVTIFNFEDTPQCTAVCYVNATTGNDAFDGGTATSAKKTIQAGINQVSAGGAVNVASGTYAENVTIAKAVTLAGAGQASTTVVPAVSNPNPCAGSTLCGSATAASNIILTQADNVTIHDMTLDGNNPLITSGLSAGGSDLDARNGIVENHLAGVFDNLTVHDVTVKNIYLRGIYAASGGTGFNLHHNTVQNVQAESGSIAMFNYGGSGTFANNTVSDANDAISANHSSGTQFLNNTVTNSGSGVHTDNAGDAGGSADLIDGNAVSDCANGYGVWTFVPYIQPTVTRNIVTNCAVGMMATGSYAGVGTLFQDNEVDGAGLADSTGLYITTSTFNWASANVSATLTGNIIKNNTDGIYYASEAGYSLTVNNLGNAIYGNSGTGASKAGTGTFSIKMLGDWWGTDTGPANAANLSGTGNSVADGIPFSPWLGIGDASANAGFQMASPMTWVAGPAVCDGTCIQKAIDFASNGDTVKAKSGVFNEHVILNKAITLTAGSNPIIDGGGSGDGITVTVPNATVSSFEVLNVTNGIVVAAGANNATVSLNDVHDFTSAGVRVGSATGVNLATNTINGGHTGSCAGGFWGIQVQNVSGTIDANTVSGVGNGLTTGCQEGRAIEAGGTGTVNITNNVLGTYQKSGIIVRDTVNSMITGNTTAGEGPTVAIAQNGITATSTGTTSISGNHTSGHAYTPENNVSCGILVFETAVVTGNDSTQDEVGICAIGGNGTQVTNNSVTGHRQQGIMVESATSILVDNNQIDGQGSGTTVSAGTDPDTDTRYYGVFAVDSTGTISNNAITGITHAGAPGEQSGVGIRLTARNGGSSDMTISGNTLTDIQKGAIVVTNWYGGSAVHANVTNNTVAGNGPIGYIAQNGIQVSYGATAAVTGNDISGYDYTGTGWAAIGIIVLEAGPTTVSNNNVHDGKDGMYVEGSSNATVSGNAFSSIREYVWVIYMGSSNGTYTGNTVMGTPTSLGVYIADNSTNNAFSGNAFRNNDYGVIVDYSWGVAPTGNTFQLNCIAGNATAGMATGGTVAVPINAQNNWWGKVDGANPTGHGDVIDPASTIDASPFLTAPVAGCPAPLDGDGDGLNDSLDNCPSVYNPGQENRDEFNYAAQLPGSDSRGDACDINVSGDGYLDAQKVTLGKNVTAFCALMRADVNSDGIVNILDLAKIAERYLQPVPALDPANGLDSGIQRLSQNADPVINILDLAKAAGMYQGPVSGCP